MDKIAAMPFQVLLVNPETGLPAETSAYLSAKGFAVESSGSYAQAVSRTPAFDAVIVPAPRLGDVAAAQPFQNLLQAIDMCGAAAIVLGDQAAEWDTDTSRLIDFAPPTASKEELQGRLAAMVRYHDVVRTMERDLHNMQRLFKQLSWRFTEVDQEMRLAGRLQTAFLPRETKRIGPAGFAALYRPATFVSGDIYDICRVDETHVAFYVADAVGHGMAASLLTMFIKNAIVSKRIHDDHYEILDPSESLRLLNQRLCEQHLPNSQFVTAAFALLDLETLELRIARAGHPYPIYRAADGTLKEIKAPGGLLGLFENEEFPSQTLRLQPGDKILLYSDGLEVAFAESDDRKKDTHYYHEALRALGPLHADELVERFAVQLDDEAGSLNPEDDVTLVVLEIDADATSGPASPPTAVA